MAGVINGCSENDRRRVIDILCFYYDMGRVRLLSAGGAPGRYLLPLPLQPRGSVVSGAVV